jgi:hypothetical protein
VAEQRQRLALCEAEVGLTAAYATLYMHSPHARVHSSTSRLQRLCALRGRGGQATELLRV